jgi:hypothetical protein
VEYKRLFWPERRERRLLFIGVHFRVFFHPHIFKEKFAMKYMLMVCFAFVIGGVSVTEVIADSHKNRSVKTEKRMQLNKGIKIQEQDDDEGVVMEGFGIVKYVESDKEYYNLEFDIDGLPLKNVKKVQLEAPNGRKTEFKVKDNLGLNSVSSEADDLYTSYEDFKKVFPEGKYIFTFTPKKYGSLTVYMTHDFPSTSVILSPEDGDTVPASGFTIEWEDMDDDLESLILHIDDDDDFSLDVPVIDTTSFDIPDGLLETDTEYRIELRAQKNANISNVYDENCWITTVRRIDFFTESE